MALYDGAQSMEAPPDAPPYVAALSASPTYPSGEDSDEWEYEYSTTETETYYVTLDLTTSAAAAQRRARQKRRANEKDQETGPKWMSSGMGLLKRHLEPAPKIGGATLDGEAEAEDQEQEEKDGDDGKIALITGNSGEFTKPTKVQILDLNTENPVVSYGGNVYFCRWEKNIGTELLFTKHDPQDPLPVLRSLPDGIDLLGASSARIVSEPARLEPKAPARGASYVQRGPRNRRGRGSQFRIPVGPTANQKRKDQARFLESMTAIKRKKGELDDVTVIAMARKTARQWWAYIGEQRAEERKKLQKAATKGGRRGEEARARLTEMAKEDEVAAARRESISSRKPNRGGRKRIPGRRRKKSPEAHKLPPRMDSQAIMEYSPQRSQLSYNLDGSAFDGYGDDMSTPTPGRWSDLEEENREMVDYEGFVDQGFYADNGEAYGDDDGLHDEDAPGEVDDTQMSYEWH